MYTENGRSREELHTLNPSIIWLHMSALNLTILDYQGVALATVVSKDCRTVEGEVEVFSELTRWVTKEADLGL